MNNTEEIQSTEEPLSQPAIIYSTKKRRIIMLLFAYSAIVGTALLFLPEEDTTLDFIVRIPFLILSVSWCFTDAAERDHRIGRLTKLFLIFVFIYGFPLYLFQTRGNGAVKSLLLAMVLAAGLLACMVAAAFLTSFVCDAAGFR
jgi:hypothetical protein